MHFVLLQESAYSGTFPELHNIYWDKADMINVVNVGVIHMVRLRLVHIHGWLAWGLYYVFR